MPVLSGFGFDFDWHGWDGEDDPRLRLLTAKTVRKALRILNRHWESDNEEGDEMEEEPLSETLTPQEQQEKRADQAKEAEEILRAIARHSM